MQCSSMEAPLERVLIAGAGDLGLRVGRLLRERGANVYALRRHPPVHGDDGFCWIGGDLTTPSSLGALPGGITAVVYAPAPDERTAAAYRALYVDGLRGLLARLDTSALGRVLFVSSSAVYGEHGDGWVDEDTPPAPLTATGAALLEAERWLLAQPLPAVVLRLAGLYGPGRTGLIERLWRGQARVPREVVHFANRIHVEDAATAVAHLLARRETAPLYVGTDDSPLPLATLYDHLAALLGVPPPAPGAPPPGVGSKRLSNRRLRASGWTPRWPDARAGYAALLAPDY